MKSTVATDNKNTIFHVWGESVPPKTYVLIKNGRYNQAVAFLTTVFGVKPQLNVAGSCIMNKSQISYHF